jgi:DNA-binding transcriptional LysR family regulator
MTNRMTEVLIMNTQQLESFIQVAEHLNFARAAESLNITQSAVSRQIRSLEEELGTKLLHRSTRSVALTPAGISFLSDAKEVLIKLQLSAQKLKSHSDTNIQILSIGCTNEAYLPLSTDLLRSCQIRFPELHPFFRMIPSRAVLNLFIHDEIDILFGFREELPMQEGFHYRELTQIPVCFVLHSEHPLAQKEVLTEEDVLKERIVICNSFDLPAHVASIQTQLSHKFSPDATNYCENIQTMLTLIQAGYGIGVLPEVPSGSTELTYIPLEQTLSLSYGFFYKNKSNHPGTENFLSLTNATTTAPHRGHTSSDQDQISGYR